MKIILITTLPELEENVRIREEVVSMGNKFELVNLRDFRFYTDKRVVVDELESLDCDLVIVRGIFVAIKPITTYLQHLRKQGVKIFDNNFLINRYSIDKVSDIMRLSLAGVPIPATSYARDYEKYPEMAAEIGYPLILKSTRMGKGVGVLKIKEERELRALTQDFQAQGKNAKSYLLQEFIEYEKDLRVLVIGKHMFAMQRIPKKGEFRANFSLGGAVKLHKLAKEDTALARQSMSAVDVSVGGVDILITKSAKRYVLEVNHTAGFVGMEKATGKNIAKLYVHHAIKNAR